MALNPDNVPLGEFASLERQEKPNIAILGFDVVNKPVPGFPGQSRDVHKVRWAPKGDNKSENTEYIDRIKRDRLLWPVIEPVYNAWLKGQEEPVEGTPLSAFPAINRAQAERYRAFHVRTVEDLAKIGEDVIRQVPQSREHKALAARFLENKTDVETAGKMEALAQQNEILAQQLAELREVVAAAGLDKRKPGRPKAEAA